MLSIDYFASRMTYMESAAGIHSLSPAVTGLIATACQKDDAHLVTITAAHNWMEFDNIGGGKMVVGPFSDIGHYYLHLIV